MITIARHNLRIYNLHTDKPPMGAAYVGRPTPFGNPWGFRDSQALHKVATRKEAITKFREYCRRNQAVVALAIRHLKGKDLTCWCAPEACHAEVLMDIANAPEVKCQTTSKKSLSARRK